MKRLALGLLTLLAVFGGAWWSIDQQVAHTETLLQEVLTIEDAFYRGDQAQCRALCEHFPKAVAQHTRLFPFIMTHDELHALEVTAAELCALHAAQDAGDFAEALARCKQQLLQLADAEKPLPGNIL